MSMSNATLQDDAFKLYEQKIMTERIEALASAYSVNSAHFMLKVVFFFQVKTTDSLGVTCSTMKHSVPLTV